VVVGDVATIVFLRFEHGMRETQNRSSDSSSCGSSSGLPRLGFTLKFYKPTISSSAPAVSASGACVGPLPRAVAIGVP